MDEWVDGMDFCTMTLPALLCFKAHLARFAIINRIGIKQIMFGEVDLKVTNEMAAAGTMVKITATKNRGGLVQGGHVWN